MTDYTRLSVTGTTRRADVVVPSDEPLGTVLPRLLDLLDERTGTIARPFALVGVDGDQLDVGRSAVQLNLLDGTPLRLVRVDSAPPPPVVIDVTDAAADAHRDRPDRWNDRTRAAAGGVGIAIAAAVAGLLAPFDDTASAAWSLGIGISALLVIAVGVGLGRMPGLAACASAAAAGLAFPFALIIRAVAAGVELDAATAAGAGALFVSLSLVVLLGVGVGLRRPGARAGGAIGAVLFAGLLALLAFGVTAVAAAAVVGTVAAFLTGLLPWIALSVSGLTGLDERVGAPDADGAARVDRALVRASVDDAYGALSWGVAATASALGASGVVLAVSGELWPCLLAGAFGLTAALRTRSFPLRAEALALWAAAAAIATTMAVTLLSGGYGWIGVAACGGVALLVAIGVLVRPPAHIRARLRGLGNTLEMLAMVSLLPLVLGALGIYDELLAMFRVGS